ncbi:signal peptide peptidase SppA [Sandarakinorhabdus sp.]|uniref:signal peptide peptidase SppA n=1 Tax=Sandarakinorhabdus sp. TaxID=1916663 RepID=UPI00286E6CB4|nr:signal peptide peptidase SppA [Sandarakinorhabdus sp.]
MTLVRTAWHVLVGIKDFLVLLLLVLFFILLWAALSGRGPLGVPDGSALVLDLDGVLVDQASEASPAEALAGGAGAEIEARDVIRAIDTAADDKRIKALVLDLDSFAGGGAANLDSVADALRKFKKSGKPINAWATAYTDDGYALAAQADKIWMNPLGGVLLTGPGGSNLYFKRALEKLSVDINVFRVGTYKAAVEPFTRGEASPESRAADQALVDSLWQSFVGNVKKARPKADPVGFVAQLPQRMGAAKGDLATAALTSGLVDFIAPHQDFDDAMIKLVGTSEKPRSYGSFNGVGLNRYLAATGGAVPGTGDAIGVVYVTGNIVDGEAPRGTAGGTTIARAIADALDENDDIKALVVRVDSGGGSVLASEEIRQALMRAKTQYDLPIVASFGPVAASGGYWVAMAADEIYAQPSTITGSIGVFAILPSFNRSLEELGINADGVKSTPYSGEPDVLNGIGSETRIVLQSGVEDIYRRFTAMVATTRKLPVAEVDRIGQGRVWSGVAAKQNKLIDSFGGLDAAVAAAAKRAGIKGTPRVIDIEREPSPFLAALEGFAGAGEEQDQVRDPWARLASASRLRLLSAAGDFAVMARGPTMQASCIECAAMGSPRLPAARQGEGLLARLGAYFSVR